MRDRSRPAWEDHRLEQNPPKQRIHVQYPIVGEEFTQVATNRSRLRSLGCPEVDQQDATTYDPGAAGAG